jgi:hypothetical protein
VAMLTEERQNIVRRKSMAMAAMMPGLVVGGNPGSPGDLGNAQEGKRDGDDNSSEQSGSDDGGRGR